MNFAPAHRSGQAGISLVELLVVIVIIAIVASVALMRRGSANEQFQRQNASRELKTAFERARFDSVKRRADGGSASLGRGFAAPRRTAGRPGQHDDAARDADELREGNGARPRTVD